MKQFFKDFDKYYIGIETADGHKHCIRGWYLDSRINHKECPRGYNVYEFRESDDGNNYLASIEPSVIVNHSGTFITKARIPFGESGNPKSFFVRYGHYY